MKALRTLRGPLAGVALVAALSLSACGTADTAAIVNGERISESEAQTAAQQINEAFKLQSPLTTQAAVSSLITAPIINEVATRVGKGESDSSARSAIPQIQEPTQATLDLVKANFALQKLTDPEKQMVLDELKKAEVTVNPRYGAYDKDGAQLEPAKTDWLKVASEG